MDKDSYQYRDAYDRAQSVLCNRVTIKPVDCKTCDRPTPFLGTKLCDECYSVESNLGRYVRRGGRKAADRLLLAIEEAGCSTK